jgi:hypothetical protein
MTPDLMLSPAIATEPVREPVPEAVSALKALSTLPNTPALAALFAAKILPSPQLYIYQTHVLCLGPFLPYSQ